MASSFNGLWLLSCSAPAIPTGVPWNPNAVVAFGNAQASSLATHFAASPAGCALMPVPGPLFSVRTLGPVSILIMSMLSLFGMS